MHQSKILPILLLTLLILGCSPKELPLPENEQGIKTISGAILSCDLQELGSFGRTIFLGIELDIPDSPYVRMNFPSDERAQYEGLCEEGASVTIRYKAKRTELRPEITYWVEDLELNGT